MIASLTVKAAPLTTDASGYTSDQLAEKAFTAVTTGALVKDFYILSKVAKIKLTTGTPSAGKDLTTASTNAWDTTTHALGAPKADDDGNAATDDKTNINNNVGSDSGTEDSADPFRRQLDTDADVQTMELAPFESEAMEVVGQVYQPPVQRGLKGIIGTIPAGAPTPIAITGYQNIVEYNLIDVPFGLQIRTQRTSIQIVFPMFFLFVMWMMAASQCLAFLPYYLRIRKVDSWLFVAVPATLIFALTSVRNTMPGVPPIGAIIDFTTYFWCLAILMFNMLYLGINWCLFALIRPAREEALRERELETRKMYNKPLLRLTMEDVVLWFQHSKRGEWETSLRANKVHNTTFQ